MLLQERGLFQGSVSILCLLKGGHCPLSTPAAGHYGLHDWAAVKELSLHHHLFEAILLVIYIYIHIMVINLETILLIIYIYIFSVIYFEFLNSNPDEKEPPRPSAP